MYLSETTHRSSEYADLNAPHRQFLIEEHAPLKDANSMKLPVWTAYIFAILIILILLILSILYQRIFPSRYNKKRKRNNKGHSIRIISLNNDYVLRVKRKSGFIRNRQ